MDIGLSRNGLSRNGLSRNAQDLEITTRILGSEHIDVAAAYSNVGSVYRALGEYDKAIEQVGSPPAHMRWDCARPLPPCHICTGTGPTPPASAPKRGAPLPHLHQDCCHPAHICTRTAPAPARICAATPVHRCSTRWTSASACACSATPAAPTSTPSSRARATTSASRTAGRASGRARSSSTRRRSRAGWRGWVRSHLRTRPGWVDSRLTHSGHGHRLREPLVAPAALGRPR